MRRLLLIILLAAIPASATISLQQTTRSNTACGNVNSCSVSGFSAIPAGSSLVGVAINDAGALTPSAGTSGGGTWTVPSGCTGNSNCTGTNSTARTIGSQYVLSSTGAPTAISCTSTAAVIDECTVIVISSNGLSFDVGATADRSAAGTNLAGLSPGTLSGTNDYILQYGVFSATASGCPNSAASPGVFPGNNAVCGILNTTSTTAGNYTNTSSTAGIASVAFKEAAASGASTQVGGFLVGP